MTEPAIRRGQFRSNAMRNIMMKTNATVCVCACVVVLYLCVCVHAHMHMCACVVVCVCVCVVCVVPCVTTYVLTHLFQCFFWGAPTALSGRLPVSTLMEGVPFSHYMNKPSVPHTDSVMRGCWPSVGRTCRGCPAGGEMKGVLAFSLTLNCLLICLASPLYSTRLFHLAHSTKQTLDHLSLSLSFSRLIVLLPIILLWCTSHAVSWPDMAVSQKGWMV